MSDLQDMTNFERMVFEPCMALGEKMARDGNSFDLVLQWTWALSKHTLTIAQLGALCAGIEKHVTSTIVYEAGHRVMGLMRSALDKRDIAVPELDEDDGAKVWSRLEAYFEACVQAAYDAGYDAGRKACEQAMPVSVLPSEPEPEPALPSEPSEPEPEPALPSEPEAAKVSGLAKPFAHQERPKPHKIAHFEDLNSPSKHYEALWRAVKLAGHVRNPGDGRYFEPSKYRAYLCRYGREHVIYLAMNWERIPAHWTLLESISGRSFERLGVKRSKTPKALTAPNGGKSA